VASYLGSDVHWRHRRFVIGSGGELIPQAVRVQSAITVVGL
jgi:hypothetical protein